jgi:hypothetical protein
MRGAGRAAIGTAVVLGALSACTAAPEASHTVSHAVSPVPAHGSSKHPSVKGHPVVKKRPAPRPVTTNLRFSGDIKGTVRGALKVHATKTGAHYDYTGDDGVTQCVLPAKDGSWGAQIIVRLRGIDWQISMGNGDSFGAPKPGKYTAVYDNQVGDVKNSLGIDVASDKAPDDTVIGSGVGDFQYIYYLPDDRNNGKAEVTIDPGLTSGTLDAWLAPFEQENYQERPLFHVTGRWSCKA